MVIFVSIMRTPLTLVRAARSIIQSVVGRAISFTIVAFSMLSGAALFAIPAAHAATTCPTSGNNVTIAADCSFDPGTYSFTGTFTVNPGIFVTAGLAASPGQVVLQSDNFLINGGYINANSMGYAAGAGPADGAVGQGGGHGGQGGFNPSSPYGSITQPVTLGSGTAAVGASPSVPGAGAIKLIATGSVTNNGNITASGEYPGAGCSHNGSAGGSIWIIATTVQGTGVFNANGGPGHSCGSGIMSGGGGGRIAIEWSVAGTGFPVLNAHGGSRTFGGQAGGAGTIYLKGPGSTFGSLTIDNDTLGETGAQTLLVAPLSQTYDNLSVKNYALFDITAGYTLTVNPGGSISGNSSAWINLVGPSSVLNAPSVTSAISGVSVSCTGQLGVVKNLTYSGGTFDDNDCNFSAGLDNLTIGSGGTFRRGASTTRVVTGNITVQSGGNITHKANLTSKLYTADFQATNITVNAGGAIHGNGLGYRYNNGPGMGTTGGAGGSYGGYGGNNTVNGPYGSITQPSDLGSSGYTSVGVSGGFGGGMVKLVASGTLTVNGTVAADGVGTDGGAGCSRNGGSGGSVWVDAATLAGTGTVSAIGGDGYTCGAGDLSGGSGGRIAIYYGVSTATLTRTVYGGSQTNYYPMWQGGSGTIFEKGASQSFGNLTVDRGARTLDAPTPLVAPTTQTYDSIASKNGGVLDIPSGYAVTLNTGGTIGGGGASRGSVRVSSGATLALPGPSFTMNDGHVVVYGTLANVQNLTVQNGNLDYVSGAFPDLVNVTLGSGGNWRFATTANLNLPGTLTIQSGGTLTHYNNTNTQAYTVNLTAANVNVQSGGLIDLNARGYTQQNGPGAGVNLGFPFAVDGSGAGHGGVGAPAGSSPGGGTYDSASSPSQLGSGGGNGYGLYSGGTGGGATKLTVSGTLTVNGTIRADAGPGGPYYYVYSGGSGGSLWIDTATITGNGMISAKGGDSGFGGGCGGGGRIAIYYSTNSFTGATPSVAQGTGPGCGAGSLNFVPSGDVIPPTVSAVTPITAEVGVSTAFSATYTDAVGVTSCTFYADGVSQGAMTLAGPPTSGTASKNYTYTSTGPHTAQVKCSDAATNEGTGALTTITVSDTVAPDTSIISNPTDPTSLTTATFTFTATEPGSTFECKLDAGAFVPGCMSGVSYSGLADGSHTFQVRATDPASNVDPTPASFTWTVDTIAPVVVITAPTNGTLTAVSPITVDWTVDGVPQVTLTSEALVEGLNTITRSATDAAGNTGSASVTVTLDTIAPVVVITNPADGTLTNQTSIAVTWTVDGVPQITDLTATLANEGANTVTRSAMDAAGNTGTASITVNRDTIAPDTTIASSPANPTTLTSATFTFTATEPGSTFECKLDAGAFVSCVSGQTYSGLSLGSHTFQVRAIDQVGNVDATPASYTWTITGSTICSSIAVNGGTVSTCITNPDGSATVTMVGSRGRTYTVTLPAGTTPKAPNATIIITIQDRASRPAILIQATLPAGQTKTALVPRPSGRAGRTVCINDTANAQLLVNPRRCPDAPGQKLINLPGNSGTISTTLNDAVVRTIVYTRTTVTVSGLLHSLVEFTGHKVKFNRHQVGTGSHPQTTKEKVNGAIVKIFDRTSGSCGASIGFQSNKYEQIFTTCAPALSDTTDEEGDLWLDDLDDGSWFAISKDPVTQKYAGAAFRDFDPDLDYEPLQLIVSANGKVSSGKTTTMKGSLLDIVEPESIEWDSTQELYPFVLDAVDGDWDITVTVTPPEGFTADHSSLSDAVENSVEALQFTLTDVGSCWECGTDVSFTIKHKGKTIKRTSKIRTPMTEAFAKKKGLKVKDLEAKGVVITRKGEGKKASLAPLRAATLIPATVSARTTIGPRMKTRSLRLSEAIGSLVRSRYTRALS